MNEISFFNLITKKNIENILFLLFLSYNYFVNKTRLKRGDA